MAFPSFASLLWHLSVTANYSPSLRPSLKHNGYRGGFAGCRTVSFMFLVTPNVASCCSSRGDQCVHCLFALLIIPYTFKRNTKNYWKTTSSSLSSRFFMSEDVMRQRNNKLFTADSWCRSRATAPQGLCTHSASPCATSSTPPKHSDGARCSFRHLLAGRPTPAFSPRRLSRTTLPFIPLMMSCICLLLSESDVFKENQLNCFKTAAGLGKQIAPLSRCMAFLQ